MRSASFSLHSRFTFGEVCMRELEWEATDCVCRPLSAPLNRRGNKTLFVEGKLQLSI